MRMARLIAVSLLAVVLLTSFLFTASAEGMGYGRFANPGQGHDWNSSTKGNNNDNSNTQHNKENGYQNHVSGQTFD